MQSIPEKLHAACPPRNYRAPQSGCLACQDGPLSAVNTAGRGLFQFSLLLDVIFYTFLYVFLQCQLQSIQPSDPLILVDTWVAHVALHGMSDEWVR